MLVYAAGVVLVPAARRRDRRPPLRPRTPGGRVRRDRRGRSAALLLAEAVPLCRERSGALPGALPHRASPVPVLFCLAAARSTRSARPSSPALLRAARSCSPARCRCPSTPSRTGSRTHPCSTPSTSWSSFSASATALSGLAVAACSRPRWRCAACAPTGRPPGAGRSLRRARRQCRSFAPLRRRHQRQGRCARSSPGDSRWVDHARLETCSSSRRRARIANRSRTSCSGTASLTRLLRCPRDGRGRRLRQRPHRIADDGSSSATAARARAAAGRGVRLVGAARRCDARTHGRSRRRSGARAGHRARCCSPGATSTAGSRRRTWLTVWPGDGPAGVLSLTFSLPPERPPSTLDSPRPACRARSGRPGASRLGSASTRRVARGRCRTRRSGRPRERRPLRHRLASPPTFMKAEAKTS